MARKKTKTAERPLINLILILFFGMALYDSGGMAARAFSEDLLRALIASAYFIGALISVITLLTNRRAIWVWLLITILLGGALAYLIRLTALTWIIGLSAMLFFWVKSNNRRWHRLRW